MLMLSSSLRSVSKIRKANPFRNYVYDNQKYFNIFGFTSQCNTSAESHDHLNSLVESLKNKFMRLTWLQEQLYTTNGEEAWLQTGILYNYLI